MARVRFEIVHPAVWLPPFIYVYHYNVVVLHLMEYEHLEHPVMIVWIGWISIATSVLLFLTRCRPSAPVEGARVAPRTDLSSLVIKAGYAVTLFLLLQICAKYFGSGCTGSEAFRTCSGSPPTRRATARGLNSSHSKVVSVLACACSTRGSFCR